MLKEKTHIQFFLKTLGNLDMCSLVARKIPRRYNSRTVKKIRCNQKKGFANALFEQRCYLCLINDIHNSFPKKKYDKV